jgi:hypothetical protein
LNQIGGVGWNWLGDEAADESGGGIGASQVVLGWACGV